MSHYIVVVWFKLWTMCSFGWRCVSYYCYSCVSWGQVHLGPLLLPCRQSRQTVRVQWFIGKKWKYLSLLNHKTGKGQNQEDSPNRQTYPEGLGRESSVRMWIRQVRQAGFRVKGSGSAAGKQGMSNTDNLATDWGKRVGVCTTGLMRESGNRWGEGQVMGMTVKGLLWGRREWLDDWDRCKGLWASGGQVENGNEGAWGSGNVAGGEAECDLVPPLHTRVWLTPNHSDDLIEWDTAFCVPVFLSQ